MAVMVNNLIIQFRTVVNFLITILIAVLLVIGCQDQKEKASPVKKVFQNGLQAPMLAQQVAKNELPPLSQRLPLAPRIMNTPDKTGIYGGALTVGEVQTDRLKWLETIVHAGLFTYSMDASHIIPDIARSFSWSNDLKTLTIELRPGHKWSDGRPFTTEDMMFCWNDWYCCEQLKPILPGWWLADNQPPVFKAISETEIQIIFAVPNPVIMDRFGRAWHSRASGDGLMLPKHFFKQYHIRYNPKADQEAKKLGFRDWAQRFSNILMNGRDEQTGDSVPSLDPWIKKNQNTLRVIYERNPYYHATDSTGRQLPFIDYVYGDLTGDRQVQLLKIMSGEIDLAVYYLDLKDLPILKNVTKKGKFRLLFLKSLRTSELALFPNQTINDPVLKKLFKNNRFRIALSYAIDRNAINQAVFYGMAEPGQATIYPLTDFYQQEWGKKYCEYKPERANAILDSLGLQRDSQGFRLRSDGKGRISINIEIGDQTGSKSDIAEIVAANWMDIGIDARIQIVSRDLFSERRNSWNQLEVTTWHVGRAVLPYGRSQPMWFGYDDLWNLWGGGYVRWFQTQGKEGVEPPNAIKKHKKLFDQFVKAQAGSAVYNNLGKEYYKFLADELLFIGTVGMAPVPMLVNSGLGNIPTGPLYWGDDIGFTSPYNVQTFYFKNPDN